MADGVRLIALAGQQNAGKSTVFNLLTGASQHVANYPGVTVDKMHGSYRHEGLRYEVVDLPGTYSLTSFSLEERVARDFLFNERPDCAVNVLDASSLRRSLYLTFQLLEMGVETVVAVNMVDVAEARSMYIDTDKLADALGTEVIPMVARKGRGKTELLDAVARTVGATKNAKNEVREQTVIAYGELEPAIGELREAVSAMSALASYPQRWLAVKLLERDEQVLEMVRASHPTGGQVVERATRLAKDFENETGLGCADHIVASRDALARQMEEACVTWGSEAAADPFAVSITERVDRILLNRFLAPVFLLLTVWIIYQLSIVQGYELTNYTWPYLAKMRSLVEGILPDAGLMIDPLIRTLGLWVVDSANTLLNYVPIFLILFALIAILEDSGYMARIAFILDRIFHSFGLHGQSTLPFILGGVFAGGCAVPGIMATKGIPDERSRLATILTVPYMNCLAKVPLYTLLVNIFFAQHQGLALFFISTITIIMALIIARLFTGTILRSRETAPFVMEMPNYHMPTLRGVLQRSLSRTFEYIKKVGTIVVAVSVCVFTLLQFPGLPDADVAAYEARIEGAAAELRTKLAGTPFADKLATEEGLTEAVNFFMGYRADKLGASGKEASAAVNDRYEAKDPVLYGLVRPKGREARGLANHFKLFVRERETVRNEMHKQTIENSFFGMVGHALVPISQYAGFDWKTNIALISSFAARESSVATLGVLYQEGADANMTLEERMGAEAERTGTTPLHAVALILFFALYPPCLATTIMVKVQTGSYKWMVFSIVFPTLFGLAVASLVFTGGMALGLTGVQAMVGFYCLALAVAVALGLQGWWSSRRPVQVIPAAPRQAQGA